MNRMIQKSKKNLKNKKGFTLIELIVVIVIIGILAAIVIPNLAGFSKSAQIKADIATARTLATAAAALYADDRVAETYDGTPGDDSTTAIEALLPDGFSWDTQLQDSAGDSFFVDVDANGDITVTLNNASGAELYPEPASPYN